MDTARLKTLLAELPTLPEVAGLLMTDLLEVPQETRQFLQWLLRKKGAEMAELQDFLTLPEAELQPILGLLIERGYLEQVDLEEHGYYRVRTRVLSNTRRPQRPDLWKAVEDLDK